MFSERNCRSLFVWLGTFLEYPEEKAFIITEANKKTIGSISPEALSHMSEFFLEMISLDLGFRQQQYVRTFDVLPQCPPYLSVHLFGEESFKRAELMAGLKKVYEENKGDPVSELPDHLSVILKNNLLFNDLEWSELVSLCILPALPKMIEDLQKNKNSYALLLKAIQELLLGTERAHV